MTQRSLGMACAALCMFTLTGFLGAKGDTPAEKRTTIQDMTKQTLSDLYKEKPAVKVRLEQAAGYAVFSSLNVKIFMLGSGQGYGMAVDNVTSKVVYMKMVELGGGVGLGVSDFRAVMIFHDKEAFTKFVETGIEFSGKASAEAQSGDTGMATRQEAKLAAAGTEDVQFVQGVEIYQLTKNGVMGQAMVYGTKYYKDKELN
jgi:lipid-binding SYLF domain-containing protein